MKAKLVDLVNAILEKYSEKGFEDRLKQVELLDYLQNTKSFQESPKYKNATFSEYIKDRYRVDYHTYILERHAYSHFPGETKILGVELVIEILNKCDNPEQTMEEFIRDGVTMSSLFDYFIKNQGDKHSKKKRPSDWSIKDLESIARDLARSVVDEYMLYEKDKRRD